MGEFTSVSKVVPLLTKEFILSKGNALHGPRSCISGVLIRNELLQTWVDGRGYLTKSKVTGSTFSLPRWRSNLLVRPVITSSG